MRTGICDHCKAEAVTVTYEQPVELVREPEEPTVRLKPYGGPTTTLQPCGHRSTYTLHETPEEGR